MTGVGLGVEMGIPMSFQRILELARRNGLPMVVTDVAGREPMVLLPLGEFERLTEGSGGAERPPMSPVSPQPTPVVPVYTPIPTPEPVRSAASPIPERPENKEPVVQIEDVPPPQKPTPTLESVLETISVAPTQDPVVESMEERFYLDPAGSASKNV